MVGREYDKKELLDLLSTDKSEFLAVTGRRRIGKTFLVDNVYEKHFIFKVTGIQNASMSEQLTNFSIKLNEYSNSQNFPIPISWQEAFHQLKTYLLNTKNKNKKVLFFDEVPWIYTPKSNFLQMLAHFWNDFLSKDAKHILIVCGSASSWLTKNIINDTGGLHNRITKSVNLLPFNLYETKNFLKSKNINLIDTEIVKVYMALGGIPYYLNHINKGENSKEIIERLCFSRNGILRNEYDNLYKALFKNSKIHEAIVEALAMSKKGLTINEIIKKNKTKKTGSFNRALQDLLATGFIAENNQFGRKIRNSIYVLNDEYSLFYHRFLKKNKKYSKGIWGQLSMSQSYKIWNGYAFETVCYKHINQIKKALGIAGVYTEISVLNVRADNGNSGFQIDLIIDRNDNTINLCEIKFYSGKFILDKKYTSILEERKLKFIEYTKTKKQLFITMITNYGLKQNQYSSMSVDTEVVLEDLFVKK